MSPSLSNRQIQWLQAFQQETLKTSCSGAWQAAEVHTFPPWKLWKANFSMKCVPLVRNRAVDVWKTKFLSSHARRIPLGLPATKAESLHIRSTVFPRLKATTQAKDINKLFLSVTSLVQKACFLTEETTHICHSILDPCQQDYCLQMGWFELTPGSFTCTKNRMVWKPEPPNAPGQIQSAPQCASFPG
jgi:hypothetical protein